MKVICIETTYYVDENGNASSNVSVNKGSIYNVIKVFNHDEIYKFFVIKHKLPPADGKWYELLEVDGTHHESKFLELPDDIFADEINKKETKFEN